jgi:hypothetical protein
MDNENSLFSGFHVPDFLWPDLLMEFGRPCDYHMAEGDTVQGATGMLLPGAEQEWAAPGRYAGFLIDERDLPREPQAADWIDLGFSSYDVESVAATDFGIYRLVIKLSGQKWLANQ